MMQKYIISELGEKDCTIHFLLTNPSILVSRINKNP